MSFADIPLIDRGQTWIHAAGVAECKTTFLVNLAVHLVIDRGLRVVYTDQENLELNRRFRMTYLARFGGVVSDAEEALRNVHEETLFTPCVWGWSGASAFDVYLVDGVGLITGNNPVRQVTNMARSLNVPIIGTIQTSRHASSSAMASGRYGLGDMPIDVDRYPERVTASMGRRVSNMRIQVLKDRTSAWEGTTVELLLPTRRDDIVDVLPPTQGPTMTRFHIIENL